MKSKIILVVVMILFFLIIDEFVNQMTIPYGGNSQDRVLKVGR